MARIPQDFIDQLLERTDIVALVDARVPLKKSGREYAACCPFHDEKSPSFTVSPVKQFYHCFGCGVHGTAISFLMEYDRLEFRDAVEVLAHQAGLEIPQDAQASEPAGPPRDPLYDVMAAADRFFRNELRRNPRVIDYLKRRGVSGEMAKRFGIGYAPDGWDALTRTLTDKNAADTAGMLIKRDNGGFFDRFRNRLMFPIRDTRGRTIAFGGRTLGDDKAKYLNSPETPLFHKSDHMYGLFEARQALRELPRLIVVEGYMDVIALAQNGFPNAVATLGTATTQSHLTTLFRHTQEVMFCFDGDAAGVRAARKALDQSLPVMRGGRRVRFLFMPEGEDPDTLVRGDNGTAVFQQAIDDARPASHVLIDALTSGADLASPDGRAGLIENARPYVNALPPEAFRTELIGELAGMARLPADDLRQMYAQTPAKTNRPADNKTNNKNKAQDIRVTQVSRALALLLADTTLASGVGDIAALRESHVRGAEILTQAIEFFANNPTIAVSRWLERYRDHRFFDRLQQIASTTPPGSEAARAQEFNEAIARLSTQTASRSSLRKRYDALVARLAEGPLGSEAAQELEHVRRELQGTRHDTT
ncbi:DNA primase [Salinisphaera aquimarina]|uniref:DNA primase n=1 Tax=Salinisphaera aquimarina TaxID=2094031 RepID=A0ABV7EKS4_9GAMM